jgi:hypothetical protein
MSLPKRDVIATSLVAIAGVLYLLWVTGSAPPGMSGMGLAVVMAAMVVLWLIATIHHSQLARTAPPARVDNAL